MTEEEYLNRRAMAQGNVPEPQPVTVNPSTGGIQPIKQSGLYAIYNQRNPYSAQAERLSAMSGRDMGGRLGQLPGIVATLLAGKANKKAEDFELDRQKKADAIMARNEAWNKIENDREAQKRELEIFEKEIMPNAFKEFESIYKQAEDYDAAKKVLTQSVNRQVTERKMAMPLFSDIAPMQGGQGAMLWSTKEKKAVQGFIDAKGNLGKKNDRNEIIPSDREDMLLSVYNQFNTAKSKADAATERAGRGPNVHGLLKYYDANDNLVAYAKMSPDEAVKLGAVKYGEWYKTGEKDENDKDIWEIRKVPLKGAPKKTAGVLNKPDAPKDMPKSPAKAEQVSTQYERPNPVPGSPGSGQAAQVPARNKRAEAIAILEGQKQKLTEANISYVMGQLQ